jgi:hypothetical protein
MSECLNETSILGKAKLILAKADEVASDARSEFIVNSGVQRL